LLGAWLLLAGTVAAQCNLTFQSDTATPDADAPVLASCLWDRDGAGPLPPVVVLGGTFGALGNTFARGIVQSEVVSGATAPIGSGIGIGGTGTLRVAAVCGTASGQLVVGGRFQSVDGVAATNVARWDGSSWTALGAGVPFEVNALLELPGGDLVAAGNGTAVNPSLLRWNGLAWVPLGSGLFGAVSALALLPNGELLVGGVQLLGNEYLVRWDGATWSPFAAGLNGAVTALSVGPGGDVVVGGVFNQAGGATANCIARWDGSSWSALGSGFLYSVNALTRLAGEVVAGGAFVETGGTPVRRVARWNGSVWSGFGGGLGGPLDFSVEESVRTVLALPNGELIAGGFFRGPVGDFDRIARWRGTTWQQLRPGTGGIVRTSALTAAGEVVVGGDFTRFEGVAANRIARRSGGAWQALGSGLNGPVHTILALPNGELVVGGEFTAAGGVAADRVARWNGNAWQAMGAGLPATVTRLLPGPNGQVLAAGLFFDRIAVWNGQAWNGTGLPGTPAPLTQVPAMLSMPDGTVLAQSNLGGFLGRWDGQVWQPSIPSVPVGVVGGVLARLRNGDILHVAQVARRWNGTAWVSLPGSFNPVVQAIVVLPNDEFLVGGGFTSVGSAPIARLARWNGSAWSQVGAGADGTVHELRWQVGGGIAVAGAFARLDGQPSAGFGTLGSSCPASAVAVGSGCAGSAGVPTLTAVELPWLGGVFTSRVAGVPAAGVVIEVLGLSSLQQPLAALLPAAGGGCLLRVQPDFVRAYVASSGLELTLPLPVSLGLVGLPLLQQVVRVDFGPLGSVTGASSSNALQTVLGAF
jgi:hypothetical protein